jgi:hypothetical protein
MSHRSAFYTVLVCAALAGPMISAPRADRASPTSAVDGAAAADTATWSEGDAVLPRTASLRIEGSLIRLVIAERLESGQATAIQEHFDANASGRLEAEEERAALDFVGASMIEGIRVVADGDDVPLAITRLDIEPSLLGTPGDVDRVATLVTDGPLRDGADCDLDVFDSGREGGLSLSAIAYRSAFGAASSGRPGVDGFGRSTVEDVIVDGDSPWRLNLCPDKQSASGVFGRSRAPARR